MRTNSDLASESGAATSAEAELQQLCSSGGSPNTGDQSGDGSTGANVSSTSATSSSKTPTQAATTLNKVQPQSRPRNVLQISPFGRRVTPLPYHGLVQQMLRFYADNGDVQMAASILLVLGAKGRYLIDDHTQRMWFHAYIGKTL